MTAERPAQPISVVDNFAVRDDEGVIKIKFQLSHQQDEAAPIHRLDTQWLHLRAGQPEFLVARLAELLQKRGGN